MGVWQMACKRMIKVAERVVRDLTGVFIPNLFFRPEFQHVFPLSCTHPIGPSHLNTEAEGSVGSTSGSAKEKMGAKIS